MRTNLLFFSSNFNENKANNYYKHLFCFLRKTKTLQYYFEFLLTYYRLIPDGEYTTFAEVEINKRGYRRLLQANGFSFGVHIQRGDEIRWRCTQKIRKMGQSKGPPVACRACLRTKMINGYEMIKNPNVKHDH